MGKKHKHGGRGHGAGPGLWAAPGQGMAEGMGPDMGQGMGAGMGHHGMGHHGMGHHGMGHHGMGYGAAPGAMPAGPGDSMAGAYGAGPLDAGLLQGLPAFLRSRSTEQFLLGAAIGAAAAWILSDEELRGKLLKAGMKLYSGVAGSFEEVKEHMADVKAEVEAERHKAG